MRAFALIRMVGGSPDLPEAAEGRVNWVLCDRILATNWGCYLVAATGPVLQSLDDDWAGFIGIVAVSESGEVHWGELNDSCPDAVRARLNLWLANRGQPTIPEGWTNRQVVRAIYQRANQHFSLSQFDIVDV